MKKLTAEVARRDISHLKAFQKQPNIGLSLREETYLQALEIALPILEQQERGEGEWIEWGGGEQPVNGDVMVETKWSDGAVTRGEASNWRWKRTLLSDINLIAYRIIPDREESCSN